MRKSDESDLAPSELHGLLDSFVGLTSLRDPEEILQRAVDIARLSTGARYGAAVTVANGQITAFVHEGLTQREIDALPHLPEGRGMLGAVLEDAAPIRMERLQDDPRSVGFPLNHVPMAAFLGVPIKTEDRLVGALYLTKPPGHGLFSEQDEFFMMTLAGQTSVAIETAALIATLEEQRETMRALDQEKSEFVANAAHELRTPLTTILGLTELITNPKRPLDPQQFQESMGLLKRQGERIGALLTNLLDYSRIGARTNIQLYRVNLPAAVVDATSAAPAPPDVTISTDVPAGTEVLADPVKLEQILVNLLTNAYRYGGKNISISATSESGYTQLAFSDDGPGIEPRLLSHLFDPFTRGSETQSITGSGLGLAIVKRLVEIFGGRISVTNLEGAGVCFEIRLPAAQP